MAQPIFTQRTVETEAGLAWVISFEIPGGITTPEEFARAVAAQRKLFVPPAGHGLILDGRGPIWAYAMMVHEGHSSSWIGIHDPRLGMVIVESHSSSVAVGAVIPWPEESQP